MLQFPEPERLNRHADEDEGERRRDLADDFGSARDELRNGERQEHHQDARHEGEKRRRKEHPDRVKRNELRLLVMCAGYAVKLNVVEAYRPDVEAVGEEVDEKVGDADIAEERHRHRDADKEHRRGREARNEDPVPFLSHEPHAHEENRHRPVDRDRDEGNEAHLKNPQKFALRELSRDGIKEEAGNRKIDELRNEAALPHVKGPAPGQPEAEASDKEEDERIGERTQNGGEHGSFGEVECVEEVYDGREATNESR